jgi:hypothetical protein
LEKRAARCSNSCAISDSGAANRRKLSAGFFHLLGVSQANFEIEDEPRNPSLDVSVLHVLSKNPHLFSDVEARIEECFRDENHLLSNTYYGGTDVDGIHP